jgi:hypothetical protein
MRARERIRRVEEASEERVDTDGVVRIDVVDNSEI